MKRCLLLIVAVFFGVQTIHAQADLEIEAAIIYEMGGAQALARTEFVLYDREVALIVSEVYGMDKRPKKSGLERVSHGEDDTNTVEAAYLRSYMADLVRKRPKTMLVDLQLQKHRIAGIKTDLQGKAVIKNVPPGAYSLFGYAPARGDRVAIWNVPVRLREGLNSVILANDNMATMLESY